MELKQWNNGTMEQLEQLEGRNNGKMEQLKWNNGTIEQ